MCQAVDVVPDIIESAGLDAALVVIHEKGLILSLAYAVDDKLFYRLDIGHIIVYVLVLLFHF